MGTASVSYTDVTTGEFAVTELPLEALRAELTRLHPAEILYSDNQILPDNITGHLTALPAWKFEPGKCNETLLAHFKASTLDGFGLRDHSLSVRAAGAIVQYLKETQPDALKSAYITAKLQPERIHDPRCIHAQKSGIG